MDNKKSFILYSDIIGLVEKLPDEIAGKLFKIILNYVNDNNPVIDDILLQVAFEPIKLQLKRDLVKWNNYIEKQSLNGAKGGRPSLSEKTQKTQPFKNKPKKADNVTVTVNVSDNVISKEINNSLSENEISSTIVYVKTTSQKLFTEKKIQEYWAAFFIQTQNEVYGNRDKKIQHFRNWLKKQDNGNTKGATSVGKTIDFD